MITIFLISAIIILISTVVVSFIQKKGFTIGFRIFTVGMIIVAVLTLIPLIIQYNLNNDINERIPLITVVLSALQLSTLDADYNFWVTESEKASHFYSAFCILVFYLMPFVVGGFILSFFEAFLTKCNYKILRRHREVFYFSTLNEKTLHLAKTIVINKKKALIVFCNINESNTMLLEEVKENRFLFLEASEIELLYASKFGSNYFEFSTDENKNLSITISIVSKALNYKVSKQQCIKVFTLTSLVESVEILNQINKGMINVILVNPAMRIAYDLLYTNPLTSVLSENDNKINCLILGTNKISEEIIKTIIWCGQLGEKYTLSLLIFDLNATHFESCLQRDCPEILQDNYDIKFIDCDIHSSQLSLALAKHALNSNYIVVSTDNDENNYAVASYLRTFFLRHDKELKNKPNISILINNINKENNLKLINQSAGFDFLYFGETHSVFDYKALVDSDLEKIAINVSNSYQSKYKKDFHPSKEELERLYYSNEKDRRSNRANALHYIYRLFLMGYKMKSFDSSSQNELQKSEKYIRELEVRKNDSDFKENFSIIEHNRWVAFNRTEGYSGADLETIKKYMTFTKSHKYPLARYHACICSWDELKKLDEALETDFCSYDNFFIEDMLEILGITHNTNINLSGLHNILIRV